MTLTLQPLFPLALARTQLQLDPLDLALLMQAVLDLRGTAEGNPHEGCNSSVIGGACVKQKSPAEGSTGLSRGMG